jgi:carbon starvation protein
MLSIARAGSAVPASPELVMNTFPVLLAAPCIYTLAYRFYSAFIAAKALWLDDRRTTPAHAYPDGHNYVASPRWVLFGHHSAAIAGRGRWLDPLWRRSSALHRVFFGY